MGEARGEKTFYPKKQQSGRAMRACTADSACGAGGARPFLRMRRGKDKNPNVLQKNDGKNSEKH